MPRRYRRRNVPLTHAERDALARILFSHRNDVRNPRRKTRRRRYGKAVRVIRRKRRAATMHPHRLFSEEWAKIRTIRTAHAARKRAAQASLNRGVAAEAGAGVNPPRLLRRWTTAAEWRMVKHGRKAADVPVDIGDKILGSHYASNPRRVFKRRGKRYVRITTKSGRKVAEFRVKRTRRGRTPAHLRRFLFKRGHRVSPAIRRKARLGWLRWRRAQLAKRRKVVRRVKHRRVVRRAKRVVHRRKRTVHHRRKRYVFTAARRRALAKARRARR